MQISACSEDQLNMSWKYNGAFRSHMATKGVRALQMHSRINHCATNNKTKMPPMENKMQNREKESSTDLQRSTFQPSHHQIRGAHEAALQ